MKKLFALLLLGLCCTTGIVAQNIEIGKQLYQQGDYERALTVFERINTAESSLFAGKTLFALNNYLKAISYLNKVSPSDGVEYFQDAQYTKALSYFQLKDFAGALDVSYQLAQSPTSSPITRAGNEFYKNLIGYLTPKQRFEAFREVHADEIRLDILEFSMGKVDYSTALALSNLYKETLLEQPSLRFNRIETLLSDSISYVEHYNPYFERTSPKGIAYNIGVALPEFDFDSPDYEIPQHLYFGIQLAVEEFNIKNSRAKAFISYANTSEQSSAQIMADFVYNKNVDVIIGPLFSQVAKEFSDLAELYEIPMLLPLANADSLDLYNNYVFQLNPTFSAQGKQMANYAVNVLGYDTLGVLAEKGSLGAPAAQAFRHQAERNGAFVQYYFEENLQENGYDISDYSKFFTTDTLDSVAMVKAVYAPFTGTIAPTLIESLLTDLEAMQSKVAILGSEEWQNVSMENRRLDSTELFYTRSFEVDTTTPRANEFISSFRIRFQTEPNQFAFIGYDAAQIILEQLQRVKNPAYLRESLTTLKHYTGLSIDVSFNGSHVNQKVKIVQMPLNH